MKKKISYLMLIVISIVGSRLIFGKDYHLNSNNLIKDNVYLYQIFDGKEVLSTYVDNEHFYYVTYSNENNFYQYNVTKYNLISNNIENTFVFNNKELLDKIKIFKQDGYIYLTNVNSIVFYKFDNSLNIIGDNNANDKNMYSYGLYDDNIIYTVNNEIFYNGELYDSVPVSCGKTVDFIYGNNTYIHFHNDATGFGCLYNVSSKKIEYLDYEDVNVIKEYLLEYQSNRLSFKYKGDTYYFNDITESNNLVMRSNGDYLFTIDTTNGKLKVYSLEAKKIIYSYNFPVVKNSVIGNVLIDDYAYFTVTNNGKTELYIWDYIKETRRNSNMISYDEKEYKFKNNELKEELKNKYNIDVYSYDQAVEYFEGFYVIPSYDDILINSRLVILKNILEKSSLNSNIPLSIYFEKQIADINNNETNSKMLYKNNNNILVINITNDNFESMIIDELSRVYPNIVIN